MRLQYLSQSRSSLMIKIGHIAGLISATCLTACTTIPEADRTSKPITRAEAKRAACPVHILAAGASTEDCACVEGQLFDMGQTPGAIKYDNAALSSDLGGDKGRRDVAIGILRLDAFEVCGLFDPEHPVSKNL